MPRSLAVCIVVYHSDLHWLTKTLTSLRAAIGHAREQNLLDSVEVRIVDNGASESAAANELTSASDHHLVWVDIELK